MNHRFDPSPDVPVAARAVRIDLHALLQECAEAGQIDELREALDMDSSRRDTGQVVRDLVYELAAAGNRDLAVDALIHATGIAEFDCCTLRDYARKHGLTPEGFRTHVRGMRLRLNLPERIGSPDHHGR